MRRFTDADKRAAELVQARADCNRSVLHVAALMCQAPSNGTNAEPIASDVSHERRIRQIAIKYLERREDSQKDKEDSSKRTTSATTATVLDETRDVRVILREGLTKSIAAFRA